MGMSSSAPGAGEDDLRARVEAWRRSVGGEERRSDSGIPLQPIYTPLDLENFDYDNALGLPGSYPYTRGPYPSMYRGRPWTMRQYAGFGTAQESNRRYRQLLEQGTTGLSVAFDLPSQMGYDSDHPLAAGEVGKVGVAIDSLADFERLFADIPLDQVTTSMTINAPAAIMLAMYLAVARKQSVAPEQLSGTVQNDILKEYLARGTYIFPPEPSLRLTVDVFEFGYQHVPRWNTISISGYHIREAGSDAVQEIAFTLANAITYVEAALKRGLDIDAFAPRLSFFFNAHMNLFEEIAKFRAARRLWAKLARERFGAKNPRSWMLRFHTQTAGCSLTAQQPYNNVIRTTIQALAAVLGGTQSLHTNSLDEALSLPTEEAVRIALRTQQIIAEESGVANTPDPLGGSYFVEALTNQMEEGVWDYFRRIDALGGVIPAIEQGFFQREIADAAYEYQRRVETGEQIIVGVNAFTIEEDTPIPILKIGPEIEAKQRERVARVRRERDAARVQQALARVREAAAGTDNLVPPILDAVRAYATLGEIVDELRTVFGEYEEIAIL